MHAFAITNQTEAGINPRFSFVPTNSANGKALTWDLCLTDSNETLLACQVAWVSPGKELHENRGEYLHGIIAGKYAETLAMVVLKFVVCH